MTISAWNLSPHNGSLLHSIPLVRCSVTFLKCLLGCWQHLATLWKEIIKVRESLIPTAGPKFPDHESQKWQVCYDFLNLFYPSHFRLNHDLIYVILWLGSERIVICYKANFYWDSFLTWVFPSQCGSQELLPMSTPLPVCTTHAS